MTFSLRLLAATSVATLLAATAAWADPPRPIAVGQSISGTLGPSDAKGENNTSYEDYTVRLTANQSVEALMASSAFDSLVRIGRGTGTAFTELKFDDDGGGGNDARLRFTAPEDGAYTIRANTYAADGAGAFTLRLSAYTPPPPPVTKPLTFGAPVNGRLADGGSRLEDGDKIFEQYTFTAAAGERVKIESKSSEFDSILILGRMVAGAFEEVKTDDDSGGDKNARVLAVLEQAGEYVVRVAGFDKDQKGAYTVSLDRLPAAAPAPRPKSIRIGQVQRGELTAGSPTFDEFRPYDYYQLSGRAGDTTTIIMRAPFDAYLDVGVLSPGGYAILKSDDDGGGDTNAKIDFKFERAGTIIIRVSALQPGATGAYTLTVE